jgi:6-phosphogluconolactonase
MPLLSVYADRDALMASAADRIATALQAGIDERGRACAALSGGSTPEPCYRLLAERELDWSKITFALVDERFVPPTDAASNEGMLRRTLAPALKAGARLAPLYAPNASPEQAADNANEAYSKLVFEIALMGMGADAHTASWFPGAAEAAIASSRAVVATTAAHAAGAAQRLTLTPAAIAKARDVILLITGEAKRAKLDWALTQPLANAPVAVLFADPERQPEIMWAA